MKPSFHHTPLIPSPTIKAHRLAAQYYQSAIGDTTEASAVTCTRCLFLWFASFGQAKEMNKSQIVVARGKLFSSTYVFRRLLRRYASHNDVLDGDSLLVPNKHTTHETPLSPYTIVIQPRQRSEFFMPAENIISGFMASKWNNFSHCLAINYLRFVPSEYFRKPGIKTEQNVQILFPNWSFCSSLAQKTTKYLSHCRNLSRRGGIILLSH